jgi:hypothetical protein
VNKVGVMMEEKEGVNHSKRQRGYGARDKGIFFFDDIV